MLNILSSYAYVRKSKMFQRRVTTTGKNVRWLLDSGAFTAHEQGQPISLDEYCAFLKMTKNVWWKYIALDKIGDAKQTAVNLQIMRDRGLDPMPVLTVDSHVELALDLVGGGDSLCIAGGVTEPIERYGPRISAVRKIVGPDIWLHGLGFTRGLSISRTSVDSVDSSSWGAGTRYGAFGWYEPMQGVKYVRWRKLVNRKWADLSPRCRTAIMGMGLDRADLTNPKLNMGAQSAIGMQTVRAYLQYSKELEERSVRNFFATGPPTLIMLLIGCRHATKTGVSWEACNRTAEAFREGKLDFPTLVAQAAQQVKEQWAIQ